MANGIKVLLVDDDKMLVDLYRERLEIAGYKVEVCHNGEEGLKKIHESDPDIVLLDIMMPKINGYETLAAIKSDPRTKDKPVIILSALMRDVNKSKALESGADDYVVKSEAMPAEVIKKIETVLQKYDKNIPSSQEPIPPKLPNPPLESTTEEIQFEPAQEKLPTNIEGLSKPVATDLDIKSSKPPSIPSTPANTNVAASLPPENPSVLPPQPNNRSSQSPVEPSKQKLNNLDWILIILIFLVTAVGIFYYFKFIGK